MGSPHFNLFMSNRKRNINFYLPNFKLYFFETFWRPLGKKDFFSVFSIVVFTSLFFIVTYYLHPIILKDRRALFICWQNTVIWLLNQQYFLMIWPYLLFNLARQNLTEMFSLLGLRYQKPVNQFVSLFLNFLYIEIHYVQSYIDEFFLAKTFVWVFLMYQGASSNNCWLAESL